MAATTDDDPPPKGSAADWLTDKILRGFIGSARLLPYPARIRTFGKLTRNVIAPLAGYGKRARDNLAMVWPDMEPPARAALAAKVCENAGRVLMENYSNPTFFARAASFSLSGPGLPALEEARATGRAVIAVTGHFGNYEAARAKLNTSGYHFGGLYRPMANAFFNQHYVATMEAVGRPVFPQGRKGTMAFIRHLKAGGMLIILHDVNTWRGEVIDFMGHPARTATSAAEMALRYDALMLPLYATRLNGGLDYAVEVEEPIPHTDARTMTEAATRSLEARVEADPDQWFWIHRRWK
ncbi:lysophospholipid acyltransferase family protein [Oceanicola sp. D3]|uniref:lysophospholipid acyltransferase family protein n=1 Tax=Oceanicola sp. D3 TaxID=2587163 RepID=UPI001122C21C|nr:lysophospholipid acyltransferase family protein [Oceanicola sp. D3]QDC09473.1 lysophospholipid acyltransferase family protein [Oceanicola sp. D3]